MMTRPRMVAVAFVLTSILASACAVPGLGSGNAAIVNGVPIKMTDYDKQVKLMQDAMIIQGLDAKTADGQAVIAQMKSDILSQMVDTEIMRQAAKSENVGISDADVAARIIEIKQQLGGEEPFKAALKQAGISEADFRSFILRDQMLYERLSQKVAGGLSSSAEQVQARHILVSTEKEAVDVTTQLAAGADFAVLAKDLSLDPGSKDSGGKLDFYPRGVLEPAFEDMIFKLKINERGTVKTDYGYHVVEVLAREGNRPVDPDVLQALGEAAMNVYMEDLRAKATVEWVVKLPPTATPPQ